MPPTREKPPTVFLGPLEISGYYGNLERGFTEIGVRARLVTLHPNPFGFEQPQPNPWPARLVSRAVLMHRKAAAPVRLITGGLYLLACVLVLLWSLPRFNSYVFTWGMSLLPWNLDVPLLRLLGKRVIVVLGHGSEARPPYMSTPPPGSPPFAGQMLRRLAAETDRTARKVRRIERWATWVIGLPVTGQFFTRPFANFYALGIPTPQPADGAPKTSVDGLDVAEIVVVHVPSKPEVKGSAFIRECMDTIVARYPHVRYVELTGRPHAEILQAIRGATFVVDQLWSDIPMAIVGTEAAALGKATVIGGYAWGYWKRFLAAEDWPPTVTTLPEDLLATLESCIADVGGMAELGAQARQFVATRWSPVAVARNYLRILAGDIPDDWLIAPSDITYGYGCGVSREHVDVMVKGLADRYGTHSLRWPLASQVYELDEL